MSSARNTPPSRLYAARRWAPLLLLAVLLSGAVASIFLSESHRVLGLARNTLLLAAGACLISLPIGSLLAVLTVRTDMFARRAIAFSLVAMLFVPLYLQAAAWDAGFGLRGWFLFSEAGLTRPFLDGWRAAVWIHGVAAIPWVALIVGIGLRNVEPELEEEALLYASPAQVFYRVTLARVMGSVCVGALWTLIVAGTEMTVSDLYRVRTYAEEIYLNESETIGASGTGTIVSVVVVGALVLSAFALAVSCAPTMQSGAMRSPHRFRLKKSRWPASMLSIIWLVFIVAVPVGNLLFKAGMTVSQVGEEKVRFWSPSQLLDVLLRTPQRFGEEFAWSAVIGVAGASLAVLAALPLAWIARRGGLASIPTVIVTAVSLAIPGPLLGVGIIKFMSSPHLPLLHPLYDRSIAPPVLATTIRALPLAILILWYGLRSVGTDQLDSSATEGASRAARFFHIVLRQRILVIAGAWIVAFAIAFGELSASILVVPPGIDTLPRRVFGLIHAGVDDQVAGICLVSIAFYIVLAGGLHWILGRFRRQAERNFEPPSPTDSA